MIKTLIHYTYRPYLIWYLKKDRWYRYDGLRIKVKEGVFHPGFFFSSKFLIDTLRSQKLKGKTVLELGCGSGLISVWCARAWAEVTASDINPKAVENTQENLALNHQSGACLVSDLFEAIPPTTFDFILVNPPYYPKRPADMRERAWFCGEEFDYFHRFFQKVGKHMHEDTHCWMTMSEDGDIAQIMAIAQQYKMRLTQRVKKRTGWEWHYLFEVEN